MSGTTLFDQTINLHFIEARECWKATRLPGSRTIQKEIRGMLQACERFWPLDEFAPYRLAAVMVSESGGNTRNTAKPNEPSYGPWCGTVEEAHEAHMVFPDILCPRAVVPARDRLQADPEWAALVAGATLWRYDHAASGDRVRGLLIYKFGAAGLSKALHEHDGPMTDLAVWRHYESCLNWLLCLRDRLAMDSTPPCGCATP